MNEEKNLHHFPYRWNLKTARFAKDRGKVFSCFACGGGSTMGYKLAGFDVIGDNEIDPRVNACYVVNNHPRLNFLMPISELVGMARTRHLPEEMYQLDILDGSPPCSSFSTATISATSSSNVPKSPRSGVKNYPMGFSSRILWGF